MQEISKRDAGVLLTLVDRFKKQRYPKLIELKEKVDAGRELEDVELNFLHKVLDDAQKTIGSTTGHQEIHDFCASVINLYSHITQKALENEKRH
jgi:hypothetical protein